MLSRTSFSTMMRWPKTDAQSATQAQRQMLPRLPQLQDMLAQCLCHPQYLDAIARPTLTSLDIDSGRSTSSEGVGLLATCSTPTTLDPYNRASLARIQPLAPCAALASLDLNCFGDWDRSPE